MKQKYLKIGHFLTHNLKARTHAYGRAFWDV